MKREGTREHKMRRSIFLFMVFFVMWNITATQGAPEDESKYPIGAQDRGDEISLECKNGKWINFEYNTLIQSLNNDSKIVLKYNDDASGEYTCNKTTELIEFKIYVKFRTCENCIQLEVGPIMGVIIGDVLATIMIGVAVYYVASQPKARGYGSSYSKASDRQNLIQNQQNDTYTALQGPSSEYSKLERRANRK